MNRVKNFIKRKEKFVFACTFFDGALIDTVVERKAETDVPAKLKVHSATIGIRALPDHVSSFG